MIDMQHIEISQKYLIILFKMMSNIFRIADMPV